jgi:hypothetical protein
MINDEHINVKCFNEVTERFRGQWQNFYTTFCGPPLDGITGYGVCPFCKSPSFQFDPKKGHCYCSACEVGNDPWSFYSKMRDCPIENTAERIMEEFFPGDKAESVNESGWPDPVPIQETLPAVLPLEKAMLPSPFLPLIKDEARRMSVPVDYIAIPIIVVCGSLIGTGCRIKPKQKDDWPVVPNLWGGLIGPPSRLKTPAMDVAIKKLLGRLEAEDAKEHEETLESWMDEKRKGELGKSVLEAEYRGALKIERSGKVNGRTSEDVLQELKEIDDSLKEPLPKRRKTNDSTVEKLVELLKTNPRGLLVFRDELVGLFRRMETQGREQDRAFYIESWSGNGQHTEDRIGRGTIEASKVCLSLLGSIQPGKLAAYIEQAINQNENDGFVQRLQLAVYPDVEPYQLVDELPIREALERAYRIVRAIAKMDFLAQGFEHDDQGAYLRFAPDAQLVFNEWYAELMHKLDRDDHPVLMEHLGKYRSLMPSLAIIFHIIEILDGQAQAGPVSERCAIQGAAWCEYLESHARRIYGMVINGSGMAAGILAKKIKDGKLESPFTVRTIQRKGWGLLTENQKIREAVENLIDSGWLREKPQDKNQIGRPRDVEYEVNPKILGNT